MNTRYREVTIQNGRECVSSVLLTEEEIREHLAVQVILHKYAGWRITAYLDGQYLACKKGKITRRVELRPYTPFTDTQVS